MSAPPQQLGGCKVLWESGLGVSLVVKLLWVSVFLPVPHQPDIVRDGNFEFCNKTPMGELCSWPGPQEPLGPLCSCVFPHSVLTVLPESPGVSGSSWNVLPRWELWAVDHG